MSYVSPQSKFEEFEAKPKTKQPPGGEAWTNPPLGTAACSKHTHSYSVLVPILHFKLPVSIVCVFIWYTSSPSQHFHSVSQVNEFTSISLLAE